jgi:uncharacterized protein
MDGKLVEFAHLLRQNGLRVSLAETMDAFQAIEHVGLGDRTTLQAVLRATLVKRGCDVPAFERLFELYFSGLGEAIKDISEAGRNAMEVGEGDLQKLIDQLQGLLGDQGIDLSELAKALLSADNGTLERLLREAAGQAQLENIQQGLQEGRFAHAIASALGLSNLTRELEQLREQVGDGTDLSRFIDQRMQDLSEMIRALVRGELDRQDVDRRDRQRMDALADKSFFYLTEEEIRRMQEAVTRLAQRLRNVISVRRKRMRRGRFDSSATLRRNLQYGGVPFNVVFDRRKKDRPQVMVLCDVSDSVRNVSRFMLQFVYSLQDLYSKVRSFIFVADLGEVTQLFTEREINEAIDAALRGDLINVYAHSDFGRAFKTFHRDFIAAVNKRTTVLILGDARNNYNLPHDWVLKEVHQRAKQVIWLNPENRMTWGFGDSEMDRYGPYCTTVAECRNLNQLYRVIDQLVAA